jgi:hypothetical protein
MSCPRHYFEHGGGRGVAAIKKVHPFGEEEKKF